MLQKYNNQELARNILEKAEARYARQDYTEALRSAIDAQQLDPKNKEIERFMQKVRVKFLAKEDTLSEDKIITRKYQKEVGDIYFEKAKLDYHNQNYEAALKEAIEAWQLQPSNAEIEGFIEKIQIRLLSK